MFENTHALPVIGTNKKRGIVDNRLPLNRKIGIELRKEYASMYPLRWEIERIFSIPEEILKYENIWYIVNSAKALYDRLNKFELKYENIWYIVNSAKALYDRLNKFELKYENIWYIVNRDYDTAIDLKTIAYNLMIISNRELREKPREILKIVNC